MTRVMAIADTGQVMAQLTSTLAAIAGVQIVRHAHPDGRVAPLVAAHEPQVVLIGCSTNGQAPALRCMQEILAAAPGTRVVVLSADPRASWLAKALQAGATAVIPGDVDPAALGLVLRDVMAVDTSVAALAA
jgi:DNA-binding NarL/FixJ family response regulator